MTDSAPTADLSVPEADPLLELAMQPWRLAEAAHELYLAWCHRWAHFCLCPAYPSHPHEAPTQLEVPDPIVAEGEDLFA